MELFAPVCVVAVTAEGSALLKAHAPDVTYGTPVAAEEFCPVPPSVADNVLATDHTPDAIDGTPVEAAVLIPVPPFAAANVPARVTAPLVAVFGVSPVVPAENVVTADAIYPLAQPNPVPLVQINAFPAAEQEGTASALGFVAVKAPTTVFAASDARTLSGMVPVPATVPVKVGDGMDRPDGSVVETDHVPLETCATPVDEDVFRPVPPLAATSVPASVIAPLVAVFGVNPVVPAENVVTADVIYPVAHPNPVPLVHWRAFPADEQDGTVWPLGVVAVNDPKS